MPGDQDHVEYWDPERRRGKSSSVPADGSPIEEWEELVQEYALENCEDGTGACAGCGYRNFDCRDKEDHYWCFLAEGVLRESSCQMCPGVNSANGPLCNGGEASS